MAFNPGKPQWWVSLLYTYIIVSIVLVAVTVPKFKHNSESKGTPHPRKIKVQGWYVRLRIDLYIITIMVKG
jgi:hypothetical protein